MSAPAVLLGLWTVYERPRDYPQGFVARLHHAYNDGTHAPTSRACYGPTLESVRANFPVAYTTSAANLTMTPA